MGDRSPGHGAAGVVSSTCETAARAGSGIELDVALVHQRMKT